MMQFVQNAVKNCLTARLQTALPAMATKAKVFVVPARI